MDLTPEWEADCRSRKSKDTTSIVRYCSRKLDAKEVRAEIAGKRMLLGEKDRPTN